MKYLEIARCIIERQVTVCILNANRCIKRIRQIRKTDKQRDRQGTAYKRVAVSHPLFSIKQIYYHRSWRTSRIQTADRTIQYPPQVDGYAESSVRRKGIHVSSSFFQR